MEQNLSEDINKVEDLTGKEINLEEFDLRLDELKDSIKMLKKLKKKQEKYLKLEEEKEHILKKLDRNKKSKKHRHK